MSNVAVMDQQRPRENRIQVIDPVPVLDTGRFEQMVRVAKVMASSNLIPDSLSSVAEGTGQNRVLTPLPFETVMANCFLIVNQAVGWGMDPFAVAQCASVVHGKVCYEGKLIAAVIEQKLGVRLEFEWNDKQGDQLGIIVRGTLDGKVREIRGTVGEWKTSGSSSPWFKQPRMQLAYRGARDWARLHAPSVMLGVYSADEMEAAVDRQERLPPRPMLVSAEAEPRRDAPPQVAAPSRKMPPAPPPAPPAPGKTTFLTQPPKAPPAPPQPQEAAFDFDAFAEAFRAELRTTGHTLDESNAVYTRFVERDANLSAEHRDECDAIFRKHCAPFFSESDQ